MKQNSTLRRVLYLAMALCMLFSVMSEGLFSVYAASTNEKKHHLADNSTMNDYEGAVINDEHPANAEDDIDSLNYVDQYHRVENANDLPFIFESIIKEIMKDTPPLP